MFKRARITKPLPPATCFLENSAVADRQHLRVGITAAIFSVAALAGVTYLTWTRDPLPPSVESWPLSRPCPLSRVSAAVISHSASAFGRCDKAAAAGSPRRNQA
jgi:hypothetical protein